MNDNLNENGGLSLDTVTLEAEEERGAFDVGLTLGDEQKREEAKVLSGIDLIFAVIIGACAFITRFLPWYSFFMPTGVKLYGVNEVFGPFGYIGEIDGKGVALGEISVLLTVAKLLLIISAVIFALWLAAVFLPRIKGTCLPYYLGLFYYSLNVLAAVLGFIGAVGGVDGVFGQESTIDIGLYACFVFGLVGLVVTLSNRFISNLINSYKK